MDIWGFLSGEKSMLRQELACCVPGSARRPVWLLRDGRRRVVADGG